MEEFRALALQRDSRPISRVGLIAIILVWVVAALVTLNMIASI